MYQFTTTNVINSNYDSTTGKAKFTYQAADAKKPASFNVLRVNKFLLPNIVAVYKAKARNAENAKVTFNFSSIPSPAKGEVYRLHIYMGLSQASQSSLFANDLQWKGKPFSIDFVWGESAGDTVKKLEDTIKKYSAMVYNKKLLNVTSKGNFLTIEATDEYQRFKFANIEKFDAEAYHGMGEYNVVRSLADLEEKATNAYDTTTPQEGYFKGVEGFGTYSFLLHNLRIPTSSRTRWEALNQDETPVVGAKYDQYTIYYCTNRGILGNNAVGDVVKSMTTHVFYVRQDLNPESQSGAFETELKKLVGDDFIQEVTSVGSPNPGDLVTLSAGNGIDITSNTISVKLDGNSLTSSENGLKVTQ